MVKAELKNNGDFTLSKDKLIIKTLVDGVMGLEKGSWLYYLPQDDIYEFSYAKEDNQSDIGRYYSYKSVRASIARATVESYIGELFAYVTANLVTTISGDNEVTDNTCKDG